MFQGDRISIDMMAMSQISENLELPVSPMTTQITDPESLCDSPMTELTTPALYARPAGAQGVETTYGFIE